jgi:TetR/AcrR family transcriptional regulator
MVDEEKRDLADAGEAGTRDRILISARTEFASFGLAGARVDRIAEHAGVNKAMIYYHFQSKENLHTAVIRSHLEQMGALIRLQLEKLETLEDCLAQVLEGHVHLLKGTPEFIPIMIRELAEPRPEFLEQMASIMIETGIPAALTEKIEEGRESGRLREFDPRQMMVSLITMSIGYFIMSPIMDKVFNITDRDRFIEQRKEAILDLFMNGVRAR